MIARRVPQLAIALLMCFVTTAAVHAAENYKVDPNHSSIMFRIKHLNTGYIWGGFEKFEGAIVMDEANPSAMSFNFTAQVDSIDTNQPKRDTHLKSPDFFSAKEFPTITFKSTSVKSAGDKKYEVTGDLTLHGQTKPITVTIENTGVSDSQQGHKTGWSANFTVKRSDFGMSAMQGMVADEVQIYVDCEAARQ